MATTDGDPTNEPAEGTAVPAPARHRGRRVLLVIGGVVVVLALVAAWAVFGGPRAEQSSEDQARSRLAPTGATTATTAAPGAADLSSTPAPGLYRYQGTGHESTSFPPLAEDQGPAMPGTVTIDAAGCWVVQIDYNTHHWQSWTLCTVDGTLRETRNATFSRRTIGGTNIDNTSSFECDPPVVVVVASDAPGAVHPRSCSGHGSLITTPTTAAGSTTFVGRESLDVGGQAVPTLHVREELAYQGGQTGTEKSDLWFAAATGLPVRNEHHIVVNTDTPFGVITYTEDARFDLQTASPV